MTERSWSHDITQSYLPALPGAAAALAAVAFRGTPLGRALQLYRALRALNKLRGPLPTHQPGGGGLPEGWATTQEFCGGHDTDYSGDLVITPNTCPQLWFASPPHHPSTGNPVTDKAIGWRQGYDGGGNLNPQYWQPTRRYERLTGIEAFAPPERRPVPVGPRRRLVPKRKPREKPLETKPEREKEREPPARPVEAPPTHRPLAPPSRGPLHDMPGYDDWSSPQFNPAPPAVPWGPGAPVPVPYPFVPGLPDLAPDGEPVRGPVVAPRPTPGTVPGVDFPMPVPQPAPGVVPGPGTSAPGPDTVTKPWERPNDRIVFDPQVGTWKDRRPHVNMPPDTKTREIKSRWRLQVPIVRALGKATEACDAVDSFFDALPEEVKAKYDFKSLRKLKGKAFAKARAAFNERNAREKNPLLRSKWGRKATCQVKARAVWENLKLLNDPKAFKEAIDNLIKNELQDHAIGALGKGASKHAGQTGQPTGWNTKLNIGF